MKHWWQQKNGITVLSALIAFSVSAFVLSKSSRLLPKFHHSPAPMRTMPDVATLKQQKYQNEANAKSAQAAFKDRITVTGNPSKTTMLAGDTDQEHTDIFAEIRQLKADGSNAAVSKLADLLSNSDPLIQVETLAAIRDLHAVKALPAVIRLADDSKDPLVLRGVSMAFGAIGAAATNSDERAIVVESLKNMFGELEVRNDPQATGHRYAIIDALGQVKNRDSVAFLMDRLSVYDNEPVMQAAIVRALGNIGDPDSVATLEMLQKVLENKPDQQSSPHMKLAYADLKNLVTQTINQFSAINKQ